MKTSSYIIILKAMLCVLILLTLLSSNLYAQDQELFEHTWYLERINLQEGVEHIPVPNEDVPYVVLLFDNEIDNLSTVVCNDFFAELVFDEDTSFSILHAAMTLLECEPVENYYFEQIQFGFFLTSSFDPIEEPFLYHITGSADLMTLTITNIRGDEATYKSQFLSNAFFKRTDFTLYPNPAKETLNINNHSNQQVSAIIYDLNGKLIKSHAIDNEMTALDVKSLSQGLYFIAFETETGERVSKKFVKK